MVRKILKAFPVPPLPRSTPAYFLIFLILMSLLSTWVILKKRCGSSGGPKLRRYRRHAEVAERRLLILFATGSQIRQSGLINMDICDRKILATMKLLKGKLALRNLTSSSTLFSIQIGPCILFDKRSLISRYWNLYYDFTTNLRTRSNKPLILLDKPHCLSPIKITLLDTPHFYSSAKIVRI